MIKNMVLLIFFVQVVQCMEIKNMPPVPPNTPNTSPKDDSIENIIERLFVTTGSIGKNLEQMKQLILQEQQVKTLHQKTNDHN